MDYSKFTEIQVEIENETGIATLFFNRPSKGNSITPTMGTELAHAFNTFRTDNNVKVVVITGNGKFFCTGMDLSQTNSDKQTKPNEIFDTIRYFPKPTIAKINGPVLGGGIGIVFCCDIRVAVESSYICFAEVKRGLIPALISEIIVPQLGQYLSTEFMITGRRVPIQRYHQIGMISEICKNQEELDNVTKNFTNELMQNGPNSMNIIKNTVNYLSNHSKLENEKKVKEVFDNMIISEEASYGMGCFLKKEKPNWSSFNVKPKL